MLESRPNRAAGERVLVLRDRFVAYSAPPYIAGVAAASSCATVAVGSASMSSR